MSTTGLAASPGHYCRTDVVDPDRGVVDPDRGAAEHLVDARLLAKRAGNAGS
jgi:hypothetical protein